MFKERLSLKLFSWLNVPMIAFANPELISASDGDVVIRVKLNWRTRRRDIGSMYLGALAVGADIASGILAFRTMQQSGQSFSILFKSMECQFLKRPESDVYFHCRQGKEIQALMERALKSGERESMPVHVTATAPKTSGDEPIASFVLALSVKKKP